MRKKAGRGLRIVTRKGKEVITMSRNTIVSEYTYNNVKQFLTLIDGTTLSDEELSRELKVKGVNVCPETVRKIAETENYAHYKKKTMRRILSDMSMVELIECMKECMAFIEERTEQAEKAHKQGRKGR